MDSLTDKKENNFYIQNLEQKQVLAEDLNKKIEEINHLLKLAKEVGLDVKLIGSNPFFPGELSLHIHISEIVFFKCSGSGAEQI
jgi:adenine C2-methylase RlmN of 23S rRNA A2503 and tRNA A37